MKKLGFIILAIIVFASCGQYKRFTYLQPVGKPPLDSLYKKTFTWYKLQPADILYIRVISLDKNVTEMFNIDQSSVTTSIGGSGGGNYFMMGHSVDKDGYISLPVLGKIQVAGSTIEEARTIIQKKAEEYINDARTEVKLVSFKVSFLGEVRSPGQINIFSDKANILEGVSLAGDITYNGNRKKVLILRSFETGTKTINVDLTRRDILSSPLYYLQPNDIVYVEPLKTAAFRMRVMDYSTFLTLFTSTLTTVLLVINLSK